MSGLPSRLKNKLTKPFKKRAQRSKPVQENAQPRSTFQQSQMEASPLGRHNGERPRHKRGHRAAQNSDADTGKDTKMMEPTLLPPRDENEALKQKSPHPPPMRPPPPKPAINRPKPEARTDTYYSYCTENIGGKCRPSNIAIAYTTLESQEWMDAKERLEEYTEEEEAVTRFLCDVLMSCFRSSTDAKQRLEQIFGYFLANPTVSSLDDSQLSSTIEISEELTDVICQELRASLSVNTGDLAEMAKRNCNSSPFMLSHWSDEVVQRYIHECCALTWQMAIQRPPMKLCDSDNRFDSGKHKLWWSCDQSRAERINYIIWPVLYDYEGGSMMVKGCVHAS